MSFSEQIIHCRDIVAKHCTQLAPPYPEVTLFFSVSDRKERANVVHVTGKTFDAVWNQGIVKLRRLLDKHKLKDGWLRVDWVTHVEAFKWNDLNKRLEGTKRNYFRYGLAFDSTLKHAFLEQELNANAMLYVGGDIVNAQLNKKNFSKYATSRFGKKAIFEFTPQGLVYMFSTQGVFCDKSGNCHLLAGSNLDSGHREVSSLDVNQVNGLIETSSLYLAKQVKNTGEFFYGWHPCFDRKISTYNTLRHVSSTYAMIEAWEVTGDKTLKAAIDRSLCYFTQTLIKTYTLSDNQTVAYLTDADDEIKLGGNAVCLLALVKYCEVTGTQDYLSLLEQLALGIVLMQDATTGRFDHVLNATDLTVKESFRIIYYDGEAAFGLMRLYGLTQDSRWLISVERAFDYFIAKKHWKAHDHWLSYCVNELTRYKPEEKYFRFGIQNISGYLDFVLERITTYPTLLELMMAAEQMLSRLKDMPDMQPILQNLDIDKFYRALDYRAHYLLNGYFWPEMAMYFKNPDRIVGSFFIRHHAFRVRIDDVEHYLSGFVAYRKYLQKDEAGSQPIVREASPYIRPVVAWGGDVNLGRRQHYITKELGVENVLGGISALFDADLAIVNLECVVATQGEQGVIKGEGGPYYYRARPEMLKVLTEVGIDIVTTANNHSGDYGAAALLEQAGWLDGLGIAHTGTGENYEAALKPVIRRVGDLNVAVFSLDATMSRFAADSEKPGTAYLDLKKPQAWFDLLAPRIAVTRQQAHVVLIAVHWGENMEETPSPEEIAVGHALIEAGADAVLGTSAHMLQAVEIYQGRPIIHDAGDLLFDAKRPDLKDSGIFRLELSVNGIERLVFVPIGVGFGYSKQYTGIDAVKACQKFADLCADMGTAMMVLQNGNGEIVFNPSSRLQPRLHSVELPIIPSNHAIIRQAENPPVKNWQINAVPEDARIEPIQLGALTLLGIRVQPRKITRRRMIWVETFWRSDVVLHEDIRLDIEAIPVQKTTMPVWGEGMDHDPCDWMMPTSRWEPGKIYRDYYGLRPPYLSKLKNVDLQLRIGIVSISQSVSPYQPEGMVVKLNISGKDAEVKGPRDYRTEFPKIIYDCLLGQTWTAAQLEAVTGGTWLVRPPVGWFVRSVVSGSKHIQMMSSPVLYVAHDFRDRRRHEQYSKPPKNFDRHSVLPKIASQLAGALVSKQVANLPINFPQLQVKDPIKAIIEIGIAARQRFRGEVIAITGTAGKSTTVSMLKQMFGDREQVLVSIDNYNSRVGAPTMLASLALEHKAAIIEIAQSALWMQRGPVTRIVKPTIALITEIGISQSQTNSRIKSVKDAVEYKSRVFDGLTGAAIAVIGEHLPCFDYVRSTAEKYARRVVVYGHSSMADVRINGVEADESGSWIDLETKSEKLRFYVPVPGAGMVNNAVGALAIFYAMDKNLAECAKRLFDYVPEEGRLQRRHITISEKAVDIIDDSWNATVSSMLNAFSVLKTNKVNKSGRKIAILGRIVHLGDQAKTLHESLAIPLMEAGVDLVVTHGEEMKYLRSVLPTQTILGPHFSDASALVSFLREQLIGGDLVLVKGSRRDSDFGSIVDMLCKAEGSARHHDSSLNAQVIDKVIGNGENSYPDSPFLRVKKNITLDLMEDAAKKRGFEVIFLRKLIYEIRNGSSATVFRQNSPDNSVVAISITPNKDLTKRWLARIGIPVPEGEVFQSYEAALRCFSDRKRLVVVKPLDGMGGKGITTGIADLEGFKQAWQLASKSHRKIIVEDFIEGDDLRILVLGGKAAAAYVRLPAYVIGNGQDTIATLIEKKNVKRRANPRLRISLIKRFDLLYRDGRTLEDIPAEGEKIQLTSVANISSGGDIVEVKDYVHPSVLEVAERTAKAFPGLNLAGVDLIVKDFTRQGEMDNAVILEVNSNPSISTVVFPSYGKSHDMANQLLDFAFSQKSWGTISSGYLPSIVPAKVYAQTCGGSAFPRNYSTQMKLLRQAAYARNVQVELLAGITLLSDGKDAIGFFEGMSQLTRAVARSASNSKEWTKELLRDAQVKTPEWKGFQTDQKEDAWQFVENLRVPVVVKPVSGSGGKGISTNISSRVHFDEAWEIARAARTKTIIVEEFFSGSDYRVLVLGNAIIAATQRIPAHVTGDGIHTIEQLVALKNRQRKSNPHNGAKLMALNPMIFRNLAVMGLGEESVLKNGQYLQFHSVANIGAGGDSRDVTDQIHPEFAEIAVRARRAIFDPLHAGIDLMAEDISKSPHEQRWTVIEVNCNPDFGIHHFPSYGTPRDVTGALVEYLFPNNSVAEELYKSVHLFVTGRVQGIGFRRWLWNQAHLHSVNGWVRNLDDGRVEALISGMPNALDHLLELCHVGPKHAQIDQVIVSDFVGDLPGDFWIEDE